MNIYSMCNSGYVYNKLIISLRHYSQLFLLSILNVQCIIITDIMYVHFTVVLRYDYSLVSKTKFIKYMIELNVSERIA